MNPESASERFIIWGVDYAAYGPVELPTIAEWIQDQRVLPDSWVFTEQSSSWHKANAIPALKSYFQTPGSAEADGGLTQPAARAFPVKPGALRRVKILADLSGEQLEGFASFMEWQPVPQWAEVVKQGSDGDAMFLVLEGELRVRLMIGGKETILATLSVGDFFGEISLFDQGPRSADVVANSDSTLLKISVAAFEKLVKEAPDLAAPFLFAIAKTLCARIRADNKRYRDSIAFARAAGH